jgi:hypothetical protein
VSAGKSLPAHSRSPPLSRKKQPLSVQSLLTCDLRHKEVVGQPATIFTLNPQQPVFHSEETKNATPFHHEARLGSDVLGDR